MIENCLKWSLEQYVICITSVKLIKENTYGNQMTKNEKKKLIFASCIFLHVNIQIIACGFDARKIRTPLVHKP